MYLICSKCLNNELISCIWHYSTCYHGPSGWIERVKEEYLSLTTDFYLAVVILFLRFQCYGTITMYCCALKVIIILNKWNILNIKPDSSCLCCHSCTVQSFTYMDTHIHTGMNTHTHTQTHVYTVIGHTYVGIMYVCVCVCVCITQILHNLYL